MSELEVPADRMGLADYLVALRRRWRIVVATGIVAVLGALTYSFVQTPVYASHTDVLIQPTTADVAAAGSTTEVSPEEIATQVQVVTSQPVARLVQARLGFTTPPRLEDWVTVDALGSSRILRIAARADDSTEAARTANVVARSYLAFRKSESVRGFESATASLSGRETRIQEQLNGIERQLANEESDQIRPELQAEQRSLLTRLGQLSAQIGVLQEALAASGRGGEILQPAVPAATPLAPRPVLTTGLAAALALMVGVAAAVLRERFDDVVYDEEMVRRALSGSVVLGRVPKWSDSQLQKRFVSIVAPRSTASEAYQRLAVNLRFLLATVPTRHEGSAVTVVTSAGAGEGKTSTAGNLAVAASRLGLRTILVDGDLRLAGAGTTFGVPDAPGLSDLLVSDDHVARYMLDFGIQRFQFLPAGTIPPNPTALLSSVRMRAALEEIAATADLVIVDSPPLTDVADTLELTALADVVLVVAREGVTRRRDLIAVMDSLRHVGSATVSAVYNSFDDGGRRSPYYVKDERDEEFAEFEPTQEPARATHKPVRQQPKPESPGAAAQGMTSFPTPGQGRAGSRRS